MINTVSISQGVSAIVTMSATMLEHELQLVPELLHLALLVLNLKLFASLVGYGHQHLQILLIIIQ